MIPPFNQNEKAESIKGSSFGRSAIFSENPSLSVPLYRAVGFVGKKLTSIYNWLNFSYEDTPNIFFI